MEALLIICIVIIVIVLPIAIIQTMKGNPNSNYNKKKEEKTETLFAAVNDEDVRIIRETFRTLNLSPNYPLDSVKNYEFCLSQLREYYKKKIMARLNCHDMLDLMKMYIAYSDNEVYILSSKYYILNFKSKMGKNGIIYYYDVPEKLSSIKLTLKELLWELKSLTMRDDVVKIDRNRFYWKVEGSKDDKSIGEMLAGATIGGVLLGPAGAIAGGASSAAKRGEDTRRVILGETHGKYWVIDSYYDLVVERMCKHLPKHYTE